MADVKLRNLVKRYDEVEAVRGINLDIADHEFVVLVGPSGCGKTTTLRMIAGLEEITDGDIAIDGEIVNDTPPKDRDIAMVFQNYALYPHMTVTENMSFGLRLKKFAQEVILGRVNEAAQVLDIRELLERKPRQLSGGQRQRVAIGRAIVRQPKGFLFDEPLSNLDAALRVNMRIEIMQMHKELGATMIYVTHDQVEAMTMADRIVVLDKGNIRQVGSPLELYNRPDNLFVAGFIGSPKMNFFTGKVADDLKATTIGVRPEHIEMSASAPHHGTVELSEHLGSDTYFHVDAGELGRILVRAGGETPIKTGDKIRFGFDAKRIHRFNAEGLAL